MKVSYHRDLNKNYLILSDLGITGKEYTLKMLADNRIPGFLELSVRTVNGECELFYEITSKVSLTSAFETKQIGSRDLERIITSVSGALRQAERYLIGTEKISLDPDMMYIDPDTGKVSVLLMPEEAEHKSGMTQEQVLAEFILRHLNHEDRGAVDMGYAFYRMASEERFSFEAIERELGEKKGNRESRGSRENSAGDPVLQGIYGAMRRPDYGNEEEERENESFDPEEGMDVQKSRRNDRAVPDSRQRNKERRKEERRAEKRKKRMSESADEQRRRKILFWTCVVVGAAAVYITMLFVFDLDLTQAGGLAFLMLSVGWLITEAVSRKQKEGKNHWSDEVEDEDELMEALLEELYDRESKAEKDEYPYLGREGRGGRDEALADRKNAPAEPGKTRALVTEEAAGCYALVSQDPRRYKDIYLTGTSVVIGKSPELAQAVVEHDAVSRIHAKLELNSNGSVTITDLNSMNGVSVNGKMLMPMKPCEIREEDMVGIADLRYRLRRRG